MEKALDRRALALWILLTGLAALPAAAADELFPDGPPLDEADFGDAGGQNATFDLDENEALSRADGGFGQTNSSHAEVGVLFTPTVSHPATVRMGVSFDGLLVGAFAINTNFGEVEITVTLRDETDDVELGSEVILEEKEDGKPFETVLNVVASDKFNPPEAVFENVDLMRNHDYSVTLKVVTRARGLIGKSDFRNFGSVKFSSVVVQSELLDSDGDGLYDIWEENGIDMDEDGDVDVDLPALGAKWDHKDLFVEMDWRPGQQPYQESIRALKAAFAAAPIDAGGTVNPDNQPGINLWIDTGALTVGDEDGSGIPGSCTDGMDNGGGDEIDGQDPDCRGFEDGSTDPASCVDGMDNGGMDGVDAADPDCLVGDDLGGGGDLIPAPAVCLDDSFYAAKDQFFDPLRRLVFRYAISGISPGENECGDGGVVGGIGEIGGNDFMVYSVDPGLVIHELGHTLNLYHGGFEDLNNKPNYVSMMNYNYGLSIDQASGGAGLIDYSPPLCAGCPGGRGTIPGALDETQLDETMVLDPNDDENVFKYRELLSQTRESPMSGLDTDMDMVADVDWDGDGVISGGPVEVDVNEDGKCVDPGDDGMLDTPPVADDFPDAELIIHDGPNRVCESTRQGNDIQLRDVGEGQPDILEGYDDWANVQLRFRQFGDSADAAVNAAVGERSLEETRAQAQENNTTDLEIAKSDLPDPVNAGEPLVYGLTVTNHGPLLARGIRVVDTLAAEATYVSDTGGCAEAAGTLTCELPTLVPGDSTSFTVTVVYEADDVADLPAPATVENTATVENRVPYGLNGNLGEVGGDPDGSNDSDTEKTIVNRPPVSDPDGPYVEECQGPVTAVQLDGSGSFDPDGDPITFQWSTDCPGGAFDDPAGETPILVVDSPPPCPVACGATLEVNDPMDLSDTESTGVTVQDTTPPTLTVQLTPTELWPPNHKMVGITATVIPGDLCDPSPEVVLTSIVSDEPDDARGNGDGNTTGDIQGAAFGTLDLDFQLRAERAGSGDGRTYTVTYTATDACGLSTSESATVLVPRSRGGKAYPMEIQPGSR